MKRLKNNIMARFNNLVAIPLAKMPKQARAMNIVQCAFLLIVFLVSLAGTTIRVYLHQIYLYKIGVYLPIGAAVATVIWFTLRGKTKSDKRLLLASGLRNILYGVAFFRAVGGIMYWVNEDGIGSFHYYFPMATLYILIGSTVLYLLLKYLILQNVGIGKPQK